MGAVLGSLELNDHDLAFAVQSQKVDTPSAVLPCAELLSNDHHIWVDHLELVTEQALEIAQLVDPLGLASGAGFSTGSDRFRSGFVNSKCGRMPSAAAPASGCQGHLRLLRAGNVGCLGHEI